MHIIYIYKYVNVHVFIYYTRVFIPFNPKTKRTRQAAAIKVYPDAASAELCRSGTWHASAALTRVVRGGVGCERYLERGWWRRGLIVKHAHTTSYVCLCIYSYIRVHHHCSSRAMSKWWILLYSQLVPAMAWSITVVRNAALRCDAGEMMTKMRLLGTQTHNEIPWTMRGMKWHCWLDK